MPRSLPFARAAAFRAGKPAQSDAASAPSSVLRWLPLSYSSATGVWYG